MKPSIGRIVIVKGVIGNGTDEQPAMINRVWGPKEPSGEYFPYINVMVFPDCKPPICVTSVPLFASRTDAEAWLETQTVKPDVAFWPDRV